MEIYATADCAKRFVGFVIRFYVTCNTVSSPLPTYVSWPYLVVISYTILGANGK